MMDYNLPANYKSSKNRLDCAIDRGEVKADIDLKLIATICLNCYERTVKTIYTYKDFLKNGMGENNLKEPL